MKKYSLSLLFLFCGLFLYGQQYVSVSPSSISVPLEGGTYTCSVDYTISPDSLMSMAVSYTHLTLPTNREV